MEAAPPVGRHVHEWNGGGSDDTYNGSPAPPAIGIWRVGAHHQVSDKDDPKHECKGAVGIPNPPCAPHRLGPYSASNYGDGEVRDPDLC